MSNFKLWVKQNSPTILMVSAIVNEAAAIALACCATKRLPKVLKPVKETVILLHENMDKHPELKKETRKDLNKLYAKTAGKIALMYAPAVMSFGLSTASMIGSHNILKGRNVALAAAFSTLKGGYDAYRQRVKDKLGEEAEKDIYDGTIIEKVKTKDENGKTITKEIKKINPDAHKDDVCCALFGPDNIAVYDKTHPQLNATFLEEAEQLFNRRLVARGYVFLYEIFEYLGFPESQLGARKLQAGHVLGWRYDTKNPSGDNYISFGIHDVNGLPTDELKNLQLGYEDSIFLKFNPDGDILTGDNGESFMNIAIKKGM